MKARARHTSASENQKLRGTDQILNKNIDNWMFLTTQGRINNQHPQRKSLNHNFIKKSFLGPVSKNTT